MQHQRVSISPKGAHEGRINPRVPFEMIGDAGAVLDFTEKMPERRGAESMQMLDEALAPKPRSRVNAALHARPPAAFAARSWRLPHKAVESRAERRRWAAVVIASERRADCFKIGAVLKRKARCDGRISGNRFDRRARLVR
jgi:hypothetical protein